MAILAVQNFKTNNFNSNFKNPVESNLYKDKLQNLNYKTDSFNKTDQISFKGNLSKMGLTFVEESGQKIGSKIKNFGEALFVKIKGENELPVVKTPIIAANIYDNNTSSFFKLISEYKVDLSRLGDFERDYNGGLRAIDKDLIKGRIEQAESSGLIDSGISSKLKEKLSYCGNRHSDYSNYSDISDSNVADNVLTGSNYSGISDSNAVDNVVTGSGFDDINLEDIDPDDIPDGPIAYPDDIWDGVVEGIRKIFESFL